MYGKGEYIEEKWSDAELRSNDVTSEGSLEKLYVVKHNCVT